MNTRQNTKEYIKGKYFLFIVLNKSSNLSLFSVRRPQYFNSHTTSLLTVACNAIPARSKVTFRLTEGKNVNYITPRNVSLGRLCSTQLINRSDFLCFTSPQTQHSISLETTPLVFTELSPQGLFGSQNGGTLANRRSYASKYIGGF